MAINDAAFNHVQREQLSGYGLNERQIVALEKILPALRLITLPHKSMDGARKKIDQGDYVHLPHNIVLPPAGGKAPGGANPDAVELIYGELFHVAVNPAEGEGRALSPFPRFESDLVKRLRVFRTTTRRGVVSFRKVEETLLTVRSDPASVFFNIAAICYKAANIGTKPERAIRAWLARGKLRHDNDVADFEAEDSVEIERRVRAGNEALRLLNKRKGLPADYSPAAEMFMRLRKQWVLDNPDMPKKERRAMAAGIPGLEHIANPNRSLRKKASAGARRKPKSWR